MSSERILRASVKIDCSAEQLADWSMRSGAMQRQLAAEWKTKDLVEKSDTHELFFKQKVGPFWKKWRMQRYHKTPLCFSDQQLEGPYGSFKQIYEISPINEFCCSLKEEMVFKRSFFQRARDESLLKEMAHRHQRLKQDLELMNQYSKTSMRILLSGSRGFIGSNLMAFLKAAGHQVVPLLRDDAHKEEPGAIYWNPQTGRARKEDFEDFDAVIHLAGKNIAEKRWNPKVKEELFLSRCRDTWLLSQILVRLYRPPPCVISASAVGIYGNRKEELLSEESLPGQGFLAQLCQKWEEATLAIDHRGSRVVHTRFGLVLSPNGGLLNRLLPLFRLGLGGKLGSGKQMISWVALDDVIGAIYHALMTKGISGALNVVAPEPISQQKWVDLLSQHLKRRAFLHVPEKWLKLFGGEMAEQLLLASAHALPEKLLRTGYRFRYPLFTDVLKLIPV